MNNYVKVRFDLGGDPIGGETLWAEPVNMMVYRLANIPFHATGYAEGDLVACRDEAGTLTVMRLAQSSGNGTLRLLFADSTSEAEGVLQELASVGCCYERASRQLIAVTIPPNLMVPFSQLANYLNSLSDTILIG